ncbi:hypothetical protein AHF37_05187 [Paragonimus kellicotti]|nr:hypothetical protein AHF37_05187 [Paragonimus kellicotti]
MVYLIDYVLPESYFAQNLQALSVDIAVFRHLLQNRLPRLAAHLDRLQYKAALEINERLGRPSIDASEFIAGRAQGLYEPPLMNVYAIQWFLTLFTTCLAPDAILRIWDSILLEGSEVVLRTAVVIMEFLASRLLKLKSADQFYGTMGELLMEFQEGRIVSTRELLFEIYQLAPFPYPNLKELREKFMYNVAPLLGPGAVGDTSTSKPNLQPPLAHRARMTANLTELKSQYRRQLAQQRQTTLQQPGLWTSHDPMDSPLFSTAWITAVMPQKKESKSMEFSKSVDLAAINTVGPCLEENQEPLDCQTSSEENAFLNELAILQCEPVNSEISTCRHMSKSNNDTHILCQEMGGFSADVTGYELNRDLQTCTVDVVGSPDRKIIATHSPSELQPQNRIHVNRPGKLTGSTGSLELSRTSAENPPEDSKRRTHSLSPGYTTGESNINEIGRTYMMTRKASCLNPSKTIHTDLDLIGAVHSWQAKAVWSSEPTNSELVESDGVKGSGPSGLCAEQSSQDLTTSKAVAETVVNVTQRPKLWELAERASAKYVNISDSALMGTEDTTSDISASFYSARSHATYLGHQIALGNVCCDSAHSDHTQEDSLVRGTHGSLHRTDFTRKPKEEKLIPEKYLEVASAASLCISAPLQNFKKPPWGDATSMFVSRKLRLPSGQFASLPTSQGIGLRSALRKSAADDFVTTVFRKNSSPPTCMFLSSLRL